MSSYLERTGRQADFRVAYKRLPARQRLFQHMRSNVYWASDADTHRQWSIWPEFESSNREPLAQGVEPYESGTATMWVLFDQREYKRELGQWLLVGQEGFLMAGSERIAQFRVLELLGFQAEAHPINPAAGFGAR